MSLRAVKKRRRITDPDTDIGFLETELGEAVDRIVQLESQVAALLSERQDRERSGTRLEAALESVDHAQELRHTVDADLGSIRNSVNQRFERAFARLDAIEAASDVAKGEPMISREKPTKGNP